jgi:uncharacterized membrane-anchored protein
MNTKVRLLALVGLGVLQVAAAGWSIARYETTLSSGTPHKIHVAPVDPADAFRGRYVAVRPSIRIPNPIDPQTERVLFATQAHEGTAYVVLETDGEGFARARQVVATPPASGDYLEIEQVSTAWETDPRHPGRPKVAGYDLDFAFDRYYMNEGAASAAEQKYIAATRQGSRQGAWLTVRVRNGIGVIDGLFIDGVPIEQVRAPR